MRKWFSLFALSCVCTNLHAAGFDCGKAATAVEKLVCKSARLSELDSKLNRAYRMSTFYASQQVSTAVQAEQKNWLVAVREKCKDEACLANAYSSRLAKLISVKTSMAEGEYVVDKTEFSQQEADFRNNLNSISAPLSACPLMIRLIDRTYTTGRDQSYGAFCLLKEDRLAMMCDDTMVGKFTLKLSGFAISPGDLVDFTKANCPPGG